MSTAILKSPWPNQENALGNGPPNVHRGDEASSGASGRKTIIFVMSKYTKIVQFIFLLAYVPLCIHSIYVYKSEDASNLDGELKKVALSTFLFAILFGLGQVL